MEPGPPTSLGPQLGHRVKGRRRGNARERCLWALPANKVNPSWLRRRPEERCPAAHQQGRQPQLWEYGAGTSTRAWQKWHGPKTACTKVAVTRRPVSQLQKRHRAALSDGFLSIPGLSEPLLSSSHRPVGSLAQLAVFLLPGSEF